MPTLRLDADAKAGVKAFDDLAKAVDKVEDKLELTTREAKKLEVQAKRIVESNLSPQDRYNKKIEELAKHVKAGTLSMEQAGQKAATYGQRLDEAGRKGQDVWGQSAISGLAGLVAGYASVAGAVGLISTALQQVERDNQKVADSFFNTLGAIGELQQVSESPEDYAKNLGFAKSLRRLGVDPQTALGVSFTSKASGFSDSDRNFLLNITERRQVAPENLLGYAENIGKVQSLYGGIEMSAAADKLTIGAAGIKTGGFTQTAQAISDFAAASTALGFSGDEAIAALVMAENEAKNVSVGGTQVKALLGAIDSKGLSKGTLRESVLGIKSRIDGGESAQSLLGSIEAISAYRQISGNIGRFDELTAGMGNAGGALSKRDFIDTDPTSAAAKAKALAEGNLATVREGLAAEKELLLDAAIADRIARRGGGTLASLNENISGWFADISGTEENRFRELLTNNRASGGRDLSPEMAAMLESYLRRIADGVGSGTTRQE